MICLLLAAMVSGSDMEKRRRCRKVTQDFNKCTRQAYKEYSAAMNKGDDGRPDFAARKACNYLQASVQHWDSDKCPAVKSSIDRLKKEPEVEYVPTEAFHEEEVMALSGAGKGVIVAGIILVQPFILAFL